MAEKLANRRYVWLTLLLAIGFTVGLTLLIEARILNYLSTRAWAWLVLLLMGVFTVSFVYLKKRQQKHYAALTKDQQLPIDKKTKKDLRKVAKHLKFWMVWLPIGFLISWHDAAGKLSTKARIGMSLFALSMFLYLAYCLKITNRSARRLDEKLTQEGIGETR